VFFHTNGFGDCVVFDDLGWPWPVHPCWEEHRDQSSRADKLMQFETVLEDGGFVGDRVIPTWFDSLICAPENPEQRVMIARGYIESVEFLNYFRVLEEGFSG
jgi:hypothetical protein